MDKTNYANNVVAAKLYGLVGSPVEMVLGAALAERLANFYRDWWCRVYSDQEFRALGGAKTDNGGSVIAIVPQMSIADVGRVDFGVAIPALDSTFPLVIVECDGHDFHERTPEQASNDRRRDRLLTAKGIPCLRFTGTDILRESASAVSEILEVLYDRQALSEDHWFRTIGDPLNEKADGGFYVPYQWPALRVDGKDKRRK